jgi:predicted  nucleic acid-binding Zn-ribbon protein
MTDGFLTVSIGDLLTGLSVVASVTWMVSKFRTEIVTIGHRIETFETRLTDVLHKLDGGIDKISDVLLKVAIQERRITTIEESLNGYAQARAPRRRRKARNIVPT